MRQITINFTGPIDWPQRIEAAAKAHGLPKSKWVKALVEQGLIEAETGAKASRKEVQP